MISLLSYKVSTGLAANQFNKLRHLFPNNDIPPLEESRKRLAFLSGISPVKYHCCENSCCCFTGQYSDLQQCPFCQLPRYQPNGKPAKTFHYIPITRRLITMLSNPSQAKAMLYRSQEHTHKTDSNISDIFDGSHYRSLLSQRVEVNNHKLRHKFFSDHRDVALGLSTDGFTVFKHRTDTGWPLLLFNFNLPPEVRFHKKNLLPLGLIPGPRQFKDLDSFLFPMVEEFINLATGVPAYDIIQQESFILHAYLILAFGDVPAVAKLMRMKGHNGISPCRACTITGIRPPHSNAPVHYLPLTAPPDVATTSQAAYDPLRLPLRSHKQFIEQANEVRTASSQANANRLSKTYGIKGLPVLSFIPSLTFPGSFPYDFMHLIWENLLPNLVLLWTGQFKDLDEGTGSYEFARTVWDAIGEATAASGSTIPSAFGPRVPNIAKAKSNFIADSWSFWGLYLAPVLLRNRFKRPIYYDHFISLVRLLHICLKFEITTEELDTLRTGFIQWVKKYEQ
jgi:hypothetical protein